MTNKRISARLERLEYARRPVPSAPGKVEIEQAQEHMHKHQHMELYRTLGGDLYAEFRDALEANTPPQGDPQYYRHTSEWHDGDFDEAGKAIWRTRTYAEQGMRIMLKWPGFDTGPEQRARDEDVILRWWLSQGIDPELQAQETIAELRAHLERVSERDWSFLFEGDG